MKELRLYHDNLSEPNCMPNDKGITFGNYGFLMNKFNDLTLKNVKKNLN